jgi:hypothetical protein
MHRRLAIIASAMSFMGCSVVLDAGRPQCTTNTDCTNRGPAFAGTTCVDSLCQGQTDPVWGCAATPPPIDAGTGTFHARLTVLAGVTQQPLAGIEAQLCLKLDIDCTAPIASPVFSDANGLVDFVVDAGFDGYVVLTGSTVAPTLYFFNPPVTANSAAPAQVSLLGPSQVTLFAEQVGATLLANRGIVILTAVDCQGNPAPGVSFTVSTGDAMTAAFYTVGTLPTGKAQYTDNSGYAGLANVPSGVAAVTGTLASDGRALGTLGLLVRGGAITYTQWVPLGD